MGFAGSLKGQLMKTVYQLNLILKYFNGILMAFSARVVEWYYAGLMRTYNQLKGSMNFLSNGLWCAYKRHQGRWRFGTRHEPKM